MRQELGEPASVDLRRLFFSPGSQLRLRCCARRIYAREDRPTPSQHVALLGTASPPPGLSCQLARRLYAAVERAEACAGNWGTQALHQERCCLPAYAELQGSRGGGGTVAGAGVRIRYGVLLIDRQPGEFCGGPSGTQRAQGV